MSPPLLAVQEAGTGPPLVLLHGLATSGVIWLPATAQLARSRRVIAVDLPGFGHSAAAGPGFELRAVADRIARGLAARGVRGPYDLVGHSLGGLVAAALAGTRPRSVGRLVLVAPAGLAELPPIAVNLLARAATPVLAARRRLAPLVDLPLARRALLSFAAADGTLIAPGQARLMVEASGQASRTADALVTVGETDLLRLLASVQAPVGAIWGDADRTIPPSHAERLLAARPSVRLEIVPGGGHVVMAERPQAFARALLRLLERL
jgi:pimeloyl-ACP methyl ester carboxylesterase